MSLTVRIRGDATHFEKTMAKVTALGGEVGGVVSKVGAASTIAAAGIAAMAVGGGLLALNLAKTAEEGKAAEDRLANIVEQMGLFGSQSSKVAERLGELADATALQTGIDDDAILATQAKLATFKELAKTAGTLGGAFDRATQASIDMQAAGFGQAEQNAVQLGKALNDPIKGLTALARSGITFTQGEKEKVRALVESNQMLKAQDMVLSAIEKQIGGTAAATAKGSERMNVAISQLTEKIGGPLATAVGGFADGFVSQMPSMLTGIGKLDQMIGSKAGDLGQVFGSKLGIAIRDAVDGNADIFIAAGSLVGEYIKAGAKTALAESGQSIIETMIQKSGPGRVLGSVGIKPPENFSPSASETFQQNSAGVEVANEALKEAFEAADRRQEQYRREMLNLQRKLVDEAQRAGRDPSKINMPAFSR